MEEQYLTDEEAYETICVYEKWIDEHLAAGTITQETAWDCYFGLLHECDLRWFLEDRNRIVAKIDTKRYNPFLSNDPDVIRIAEIRLKGVN
jgi:hypothetical protein